MEIDFAAAQALRAQGRTYAQIAAELGCSRSGVTRCLSPEARAKHAAAVKAWASANPDKVNGYTRANYAANPEPKLQRNRAWQLANPEVFARSVRASRVRTSIADANIRFRSVQQAAQRHATKVGLPSELIDIEALCERDKWTCQICECPVDRTILERFHPYGMSLDHVVPESRGGGWTWDNIQLAHRGCNVMRGCLSMTEARAFAQEFMLHLATQ